MSTQRPSPSPRTSRGFTLIEVLVALVLVSLLSLMAWRALDGMGRAGELTDANEQQLQRMQISLAQWTADLDAMTEAGAAGIQTLDFDGQRLRLTRHSSQPHAGIVVVAWTLRGEGASRTLQRYASAPLTSKDALRAAWLAADRWSRTVQADDAPYAVTLVPASRWQLFYNRDGAWSNAQSAAGVTNVGAVALPDGIQLILDVPGGKLTRYWVSPTLGATK